MRTRRTSRRATSTSVRRSQLPRAPARRAVLLPSSRRSTGINTVDAQLEQAAFAENAVRYQATLTFLSSRFRSLMTAITGQ